jgi:hypothetical protein
MSNKDDRRERRRRTFLKILATIVLAISPQLRKWLEDWLDGIYAKAQSTPNPNDDAFVEVLADIIGHDLPE